MTVNEEHIRRRIDGILTDVLSLKEHGRFTDEDIIANLDDAIMALQYALERVPKPVLVERSVLNRAADGISLLHAKEGGTSGWGDLSIKLKGLANGE